MNEMGPNRYGKQAVRLVKVSRGPERHELRDLTVGIALEGDFADAHVSGSNALVVTTDTMKNTAYALAPAHLTGAVETYAIALGRHFLVAPQVQRVTIDVRQHAWERLAGAAGPAPDAFRRTGAFTRTVTVVATRQDIVVESGVDDLVLMKTSRSAFRGFPRDAYTTLREADDRLMATRMTATWRYGSAEVDWDAVHAAALATLLEVFADHDSLSVQHSIWLMGDALLRRHPELDEVRMVLPNLHHWPVDLTPFGLADEGEVYVATTEPHGHIEATVRRASHDAGGGSSRSTNRP